MMSCFGLQGSDENFHPKLGRGKFVVDSAAWLVKDIVWVATVATVHIADGTFVTYRMGDGVDVDVDSNGAPVKMMFSRLRYEVKGARKKKSVGFMECTDETGLNIVSVPETHVTKNSRLIDLEHAPSVASNLAKTLATHDKKIRSYYPVATAPESPSLLQLDTSTATADHDQDNPHPTTRQHALELKKIKGLNMALEAAAKINAAEVKKLHKKIKNLTGSKEVLEAQIKTAKRTHNDKLKAERARRKAAENKLRELEAEPAVESESSPDSSPPNPPQARRQAKSPLSSSSQSSSSPSPAREPALKRQKRKQETASASSPPASPSSSPAREPTLKHQGRSRKSDEGPHHNISRSTSSTLPHHKSHDREHRVLPASPSSTLHHHQTHEPRDKDEHHHKTRDFEHHRKANTSTTRHHKHEHRGKNDSEQSDKESVHTAAHKQIHKTEKRKRTE
jgi:hypothetical protein